MFVRLFTVCLVSSGAITLECFLGRLSGAYLNVFKCVVSHKLWLIVNEQYASTHCQIAPAALLSQCEQEQSTRNLSFYQCLNQHMVFFLYKLQSVKLRLFLSQFVVCLGNTNYKLWFGLQLVALTREREQLEQFASTQQRAVHSQ